MIRSPSRIAALLLAATALFGCELFANVDRSLIASGLGGATPGAGGAGGTIAASTASSGTGGVGTGGTGGGGCKDAAACPGMDTDCQQRSCSAGVCGFSFTVAGTPTSMQTKGDCMAIVCDGSGGEKSQIDDTNTFDDGNDCTSDTCNAGTPVNSPIMAGAACADNGGKLCDGSGSCVGCLQPSDCASSICTQHKCLPASCSDMVQNNGETDVDCGGGVCLPCADGLKCLVASDCKDDVCSGSPLACQPATCSDMVKNGAETDVDCGGGACPKCGPGLGCAVDADCTGGHCSGTTCLPSCTDQVKNGGETDVDCGGPTCAKCVTGKACKGAGDCASGVCTGDVCLAPTCGDGVKNGLETDVDCGGPMCPQCPNLEHCAHGSDCQSGSCVGGVCRAPTCTDGVKNGAETDVDCGGPTCDAQGKKCAAGLGCGAPVDCQSAVCTGGSCRVAACGDGVTNGAEQCDDGNTVSGDGCSSTCMVEPGYTCNGAPSVCTTTCGDGVAAGTEACDDGNTASGDGCSSTCTVEAGFTCAGSAPSVCTPTCGDGQKKGNEGCDDGNLVSGDGCSSTCTVEAGFTCAGSPSVCKPVCGDGQTKGAEQCDDGNLVSGDGCSSTCTVEAGFTCAGSPSVCTPTCGDGQKKGNEGCDDGNTVSGDGCSSTCTVEPGFACVGSAPSVCTAICGDGHTKGAEQCDDGNTVSGDGCSAGCTIEVGFTCAGSPSVCTAICGDGKKRGNEQCDDGNLVNGDGCSSTCTIEPGFTCAGSPSVCTAVCGDGMVLGSEGCDDGNLVNGDGCSSTCTVEPGFTCQGSPSACTAICGDGLKKGNEGCDDGNTVSGDGCSSTCTVEPGYVCAGSPSVCTTVCGDGVVTGAEQCDDGNTKGGDGCSAACTVEVGFTCAGSPSACTPICGDGLVRGNEGCDDGNTASGDGCSSTCTVEPGYACAGSPSACKAICGDGVVTGTEHCDDGNLVNGDGCSSTCTVELGYTCVGSPSVCSTTCGDGIKAGNEQCDDGNLVNGDCCSSTCQAEAGCEIELNNTPATANSFSAIEINNVVKGLISPAGDLDYYLYTVPPSMTATLTAQTLDGFLTSTCASNIDTLVNVYDTAGVLLGSNEFGGSGGCSLLTVSGLSAGSYYVEVAPVFGGQTFDYTLQLTSTFAICGNGILEPGEECDDGNLVNGDGCSSNCLLETFAETEPNDTCATANGPVKIPPGKTGVLVSGAIVPDTDQDWFAFVVPAYADVRFETFDEFGPGNCSVDTVIQAFGPSCAPLGPSQDQGGLGNCSLLDPTVETQTQHLAPGTYEVKVTSSQGQSSFHYTMQATLVALCGDGVVEGSEACDGTPGCGPDCTLLPVCGNGAKEAGEQCDDGNTVGGDGCSATCQWEKTAEVEPNDTTAGADTALPVITSNTNLTGSISPLGDVDIFKLAVAAAQVVRFEVFDPSGSDCVAMPIMTLTLLDSTGAELKQDIPPGDYDASGIGVCPALVVNLDPGTYYIEAKRGTVGTIPSYFLQIEFEKNNGSAVEPDNTIALATPDPGPDTFIFGAHQPAQLDVFEVTLTPGPPRSLRAEIVEGDDVVTCESYQLATELVIYDSAGNQLSSDDTSGRGYCSLIDGTGAKPNNPEMHDLPAGTYYLQVGESFLDNAFNYNLVVTIR